MPNEENTKQVVDLALVPVCAIVEGGDGGHGRGLVGVGLDPDAGVVADGEQVVDYFEAGVACRVVDGRDVADLGELGGGVVLEEGEGGENAGGGNVDCELVFPDGESADGT